MNFGIHLRAIFATRGRASTYTPPVGDAVECRAIRQGGGQPIALGPVKVTPERTSFHVLRADIPAPVNGSTLDWDGETFTVDAHQPVFRDADGLMWELDVSWGLDVIYRAPTGAGATQNPPIGAGFTVAANASAGAASLSIKSGFAAGRLAAGDKFTITGNATTYTVTGPGVSAVDNQFTAVPITPVLAANAALGAAVSFDFARDYTVRAAVASYEAKEIAGNIQVGDRRLVVLQSAFDAAGQSEPPQARDRITFEAALYNVITATAIYQAGEPYAWDLQLRGTV
jgi:hypothetical protein